MVVVLVIVALIPAMVVVTIMLVIMLAEILDFDDMGDIWATSGFRTFTVTVVSPRPMSPTSRAAHHGEGLGRPLRRAFPQSRRAGVK